MDSLLEPQIWVALLTLTALEIVLGVDNIIFLSISVERLPPELRQKGRILGLFFAMLTRVLFLLTLTWIIGLTKPLLTIADFAISGRMLILVGGGGFLLIKSVMEIARMFAENSNTHPSEKIEKYKKSMSSACIDTLKFAKFWPVLLQIAVIDIVFSLDSVITAVGLANQVWIMVLAIVLAMFVMMVCAQPIGEFIDKQPTIKMLALSFLVLVGLILVCEGFNIDIPKSYVYVAMGFSVLVELMNIQLRKQIMAKK